MNRPSPVEAAMTQIRGIPTDTTAGADFEWVNQWAAASGLSAAQKFAAEPAKPAEPARPAEPVARAKAFPAAPGQLDRDIAEIERARDALLGAEAPARRREPVRRAGRRNDTVPVLVGGLLAVILLVVYGAIASIMQ